ncbi:MAG: HAD family hydrolase, partial [Chitinophagaceae bacterium]|nr:HAD family hydrolase [Chitinophagaceae bacterium]
LTGYVGYDHFNNAWRRQGAMDTLISLGSIAAIAYSFLLIAQPHFIKGNSASTFFSVPMMILGFLKLSHALRDQVQAYIEAETTMLSEHKNKLPVEATIKNSNHCEQKVPVSTVTIGSIIYIEKDEIVPIDGTFSDPTPINIKEYLHGRAGETSKKKGDTIYAGTKNTTENVLSLTTICTAEENEIGKVIVSLKTKPSPDASIEWISKYFLTSVLGIASASSLCWGIFGPQPATSNAIQVFLSVVLSACPCGLGLLSINASVTKTLALEEGILIKNNNTLLIHQATDFCFDKCGTLTTGEYMFAGTLNLENPTLNKKDMSSLAYVVALQKEIPKSEHTAITKAFLLAGDQEKTHIEAYKAFDFFLPTHGRRGGKAMINSKEVVIGNQALLESWGIKVHEDWKELALKNSSEEQLPIFLVMDKRIHCLLLLRSVEEKNQEFRIGSESSIDYLMSQSKNVHILTGDSKARAQALGLRLRKAGRIVHISSSKAEEAEAFTDPNPIIFKENTADSPNSIPTIYIRSEQLPQHKVNYIKQLQQKEKCVVMIGDGSND